MKAVMLDRVEAVLRTQRLTLNELVAITGHSKQKLRWCMRVLEPPCDWVRQPKSGKLAKRYGPLP